MRQEGVVCDFDFRKLSPEQIDAGARDLMSRVRSEYDKIGKLKSDEVNFENCIQVKTLTCNLLVAKFSRTTYFQSHNLFN